MEVYATNTNNKPRVLVLGGGFGGLETTLDMRMKMPHKAKEMYRVGTSPMWRLGKMMLGMYLPCRFKAGNPFHADALNLINFPMSTILGVYALWVLMQDAASEYFTGPARPAYS